MSTRTARARPVSLAVPGIVLGLGLGGFLDGIALHQIFQWHNMLSSTQRWPTTTVENLETNMLADGLFHAATWTLVAFGLWLLWRAMRGGAYGSGSALLGWMLAGWGIFERCGSGLALQHPGSARPRGRLSHAPRQRRHARAFALSQCKT